MKANKTILVTRKREQQFFASLVCLKSIKTAKLIKIENKAMLKVKEPFIFYWCSHPWYRFKPPITVVSIRWFSFLFAHFRTVECVPSGLTDDPPSLSFKRASIALTHCAFVSYTCITRGKQLLPWLLFLGSVEINSYWLCARSTQNVS